METARGGEFGGGRENAGHDHGHDQVTLRARRTRENGLQAESAQSAENGGDMAVRSGALNAESVGGRDEGIAFENPTKGIDLSRRPGGKIGQGSFDDFAIHPGRLAEEDSGRGVTIGHGFHVHGQALSYLLDEHEHKTILHGYKSRDAHPAKSTPSPATERLGLLFPLNIQKEVRSRPDRYSCGDGRLGRPAGAKPGPPLINFRGCPA